MTTSIFYDGKYAKAHQVQPALEGDHLLIRAATGELLASWPIAGLIRLSAREAAGDYCLTSGGAARLILRDEAIQLQLAARLSERVRAPSRWRQDGKIVGICAAIAVMLGLFLWQGIPLLTGPITALISKEMEYEIGRLAYEGFVNKEGRDKICRTPAGERALARLAVHVLDGEELGLPPDMTLKIPKITVLDLDQENAIALPGGFIIIFRGLLDQARDPDMIAGVLAHEAGHIAGRHGLRRLVAASVLWFFYWFWTADFVSIPAFAVLLLVDSSYTRTMEREADRFADDLMRRKKINTAALARWFETLEKKNPLAESGMFEYLTTHPPSEDRADFFAQKNNADAEASLGTQDWAALKNICSSVQEKS